MLMLGPWGLPQGPRQSNRAKQQAPSPPALLSILPMSLLSFTKADVPLLKSSHLKDEP